MINRSNREIGERKYEDKEGEIKELQRAEKMA